MNLSEEFSDFGFGDIGTDSELLLRCVAAALRTDPSPSSLVDMTGAEVRVQFGDVAEAMRRAIDFLKTNFHIRHLGLLPYSALLIPLTAFFFGRPAVALSDTQHTVLTRWLWRSSFSCRYSGNPQRNIKRDIQAAVRLRDDGESDLGSTAVSVDARFFVENRFSLGNVATKAFVLLLAQQRPRSFLSGEPVNLEAVLSEANRGEYHHCFPRAMLEEQGEPPERIDALANYAIINRVENRTISAKPPSEYRTEMPADPEPVLSSALIPEFLFEGDYGKFLTDRAEELARVAQDLT